jgi:hypothetical protein
LTTNTKFTKQERALLIAALDNEYERYEIIARWLMSRMPGSFEKFYLPKIRLIESTKQKLLLLDVDDEYHHEVERQ